MLVLASASPRRRELLSAAGYRFEVKASRIDEPEPEGLCDVRLYTSDLAFRKAWEVGMRRPGDVVLAADTACEVAGEILNKPRDRADAERMIQLQEDRDAKVVTAVVLFRGETCEWVGAVETSVVRVRPLSDAELGAYLDSGLWQGKAGGYGVQDDDPFVRVVSGTWSNVVGLPMERLKALWETYPGFAG